MKARNRLYDFCQYINNNYILAEHTRLLCDKLEAVERGEILRLMIIMPPRHSKTYHVSLFFPCWCLGRNPEIKITQAGYSADISLKHSRDARAIFTSEKYRTLFPDTVSTSAMDVKRSAHEWGTKQGGGYYSVGVGGGLSGRGYDIGIIDDPFKDYAEASSETIREARWQWYAQVFRTRPAPGGRIILCATRWHEDDLHGRLLSLQELDSNADKWEVLHMPAISDDNLPLWPQRYPLTELEKIKSSIGFKAFESLYQGRPTAASGNIIKYDWWTYYNELPSDLQVVQSWDTAFKTGSTADFSVCTTWGISPSDYYILDLWRGRVAFPELKRMAIQLYDHYKPQQVIVEDKASGQSLIQELQKGTRMPITKFKPDKDKVARVNAITPLIESGKVKLPEQAAWLYEFLQECSQFPDGKHDDQVDSMSQFLNSVRETKVPDIWFL